MTIKITAIVFDKPYSVELRELEMERCAADEILAETMYSFVSPGTELRVLRGHQPDPQYPLIPGYSWVGRVLEVGRNVEGWDVGDLVSGRNPVPVSGIASRWGGQASHHRCSTTDTIVKLPRDADPWDYVHAEVAAISYRGVTAANPMPTETAVVIGQGMIGLFNAKWLLVRGAKVVVLDLEEYRLAPARKWGVAAALDARDPDVRAKTLALCPDGADLVFESSSSIEAAKLAGTLLRKPFAQAMRTTYRGPLCNSPSSWPRLVFQATYHNKTIEMQPPGLLAGVEGALVIQPFDRSVADRMDVVELIRRGHLPISDVLPGPTKLEDAPEAYLELESNPSHVRGLAIKWK